MRRLWAKRKWSMLILVWAGVVIPVALYLTFTNPDMTRTRLFLTYWQVWTAAIVIGVVLHALKGWHED